jgi:hypothetical protein
MRAARGGRLMLPCCCSLLLPTTHDDEIENLKLTMAWPGELPVPFLRSSPMVFPWTNAL